MQVCVNAASKSFSNLLFACVCAPLSLLSMPASHSVVTEQVRMNMKQVGTAFRGLSLCMHTHFRNIT